MTMRAGQGLAELSQYNTNVVIHALRRLVTGSQTDLVEATGLSAQTISVIVRELADRGVLREAGRVSVGRGRPRVMLELVGPAAHAVGVHIDPSRMSAVVLDLRGQTVSAVDSDAVDPQDMGVSMDEAARIVRQSCREGGLTIADLSGIAVAVPGPIDTKVQSLVNPVWLPGWQGGRPADELGQRLGIEDVVLVKDTVAAVTGETWVRGGEAVESTMVFIYVGTGFGVGISIHGDPLGGSTGNAGEVGRVMVALGAEGRDVSEQPGSGTGNDPAVLVTRAHDEGLFSGAALRTYESGAVRERFGALVALAHGGESGAVDLLTGAGRAVGALATVVAEMIDADTVVFGGPYWELVREWYEPEARAALDRPSARGPARTRVLSSAMSESVGAVGAAAVVLDRRFVPRPVQRTV